jgi:predicted AAA+ superfamily ATPase
LFGKRPVKRLLLKALIEWKQSKDRRPLLLDGARQVGKSYLLEFLFGKEHFNNVFKLNFDEDDNAHALFTPTRTANDVLDRISLYIGKDFDPANDLLFFDEIGYCQQALDSLKYFNEQRPDVLLCASGSNIGLLKSFPVGQNHDTPAKAPLLRSRKKSVIKK